LRADSGVIVKDLWMYTVREYTVLPTLPEPLTPLRELAKNLWWSWNPEAQELFRRLDPNLWQQSDRNPVRLLNTIDQDCLSRAAEDSAFLAHLDRVMKLLEADMTCETWFDREYSDLTGRRIAYFSAEFGLHECLPVYSGGLGVLAGDHLKSASDLGVPIVGVSLLYRHGYFHQHLSRDGLQFEEYPPLDLQNAPITLITDDQGAPKKVWVPLGGHSICVQIWKAQVGRVELYLLDTLVPENQPHDQEITGKLYGGDQRMRIRQEVILGVGGMRVLGSVGYEPDICHMNEGHCAFLVVERIRHLVQTQGLSFDQAKEAVAGSTLFTTHTPVPAGIDTFPSELVEEHMGPLASETGLSVPGLLALGQLDAAREHEPFSMAILALRLANTCNGVSKVHASVARRMWQPLWKELPVSEVPISSVTNGIHIRTWQSLEMARLFERYLGPDWARNPLDSVVWQRVSEIPDEELWRACERLRERLVVASRAHLKKQLERRGAPPAEVDAVDDLLDPAALTVGFARRFATYKRATLFLSDEERLEALLANDERPIQFVFAGKAHPRDDVGKELIKRIVDFAGTQKAHKRVVFLEDYAMGIARSLVQGVDVWLNNPVKLFEASGTSGMKVTPNGGINFSVLDGWWPEAYDGSNGWIVGDEHIYDSDGYQDYVESTSIYETLEREIIPLFYDRSRDGLPREWIAKIKASMRTCSPQFSANRMLREYTDRLYGPAMRRSAKLVESEYEVARALAAWKKEIAQNWEQVRIEEVKTDGGAIQPVGKALDVAVRVHLGSVAPKDVSVELYHGLTSGVSEVSDGEVTPMNTDGDPENGTYRYVGKIPCRNTGRHGFAVRILPNHPHIEDKHSVGLIRWG